MFSNKTFRVLISFGLHKKTSSVLKENFQMQKLFSELSKTFEKWINFFSFLRNVKVFQLVFFFKKKKKSFSKELFYGYFPVE